MSHSTTNCRCSGSGANNMKWAVSYADIENQASHGKWATGMILWKTTNVIT